MSSTCHGTPVRRPANRAWIAGLLAAALLLSACTRGQSQPGTEEILSQYRPADWSPVESVPGFQEINIDGDAESEWLYFYHYDSPPEQTNGPIGGIIYDVQQNSNYFNPAVTIPFPYQPMAFFVPYRLLPDWTWGKGQGYLGDKDVTWEAIKVPKTLTATNELLVQGTGASGAVTRVSLFRWGGLTQGYGVTYFQGSYSVSIDADRKPGEVVDEVVTLNALNDRSKLCEKTVWKRVDDSAAFTSSQPAIVFCLGASPSQPTYPEAVVLAYLLTQNKDLVVSTSLPEVQAVVPAPVTRVLTLVYPGAATVEGTGTNAKSRMNVETVLEASQGQCKVAWGLEEQRPSPEERTTRWRIVSASCVP